MKCEVVSQQHGDALTALFSRAGVGCHCRWWHFEGDDYSWVERCNLMAEKNSAELDDALQRGSDEARGIVALDGDTVIGWMKLCPAPAMAKLFGRRVYRSLDCFEGERSDVLIIGCMLIDPEWRLRGVTKAMVACAVEAGRKSGARAIEAFPRRPRETVRDDEMWMGPPSAFLDNGFEEIAGPEPYPVLRCVLR
jgi:GNAT superfamily N-acetyltransferase